MSKVITIRNCSDCPYIQIASNNHYTCTLTKRLLKDIRTIDYKCPLKEK